MDKQLHVLYDGILFSLKMKKVFLHSITNVYLENIMLSEKKPVMKDHIIYDSINVKCPEQVNVERRKVDQWLLWAGAEEGQGTIAKGYGISSEGDKNVLKLIVVSVVQLCEYSKNS